MSEQTGTHAIVDVLRSDIALMRAEIAQSARRLESLEASEKAARSSWAKTVLAVVLTLALPAIGVIYEAGMLRASISEQARTLDEIRASIARIADHETRLRLIESGRTP